MGVGADAGGASTPKTPRDGPLSARLAKSTLTLIPLLGIHEVVFAFITDEHAQGTLRYVKLFFDLFLSSFQVSPARRGAASRGPRAPATGPSHLSSLCAGDAGGHSLLLRQQGGEWAGMGRGGGGSGAAGLWGRGAVPR